MPDASTPEEDTVPGIQPIKSGASLNPRHSPIGNRDSQFVLRKKKNVGCPSPIVGFLTIGWGFPKVRSTKPEKGPLNETNPPSPEGRLNVARHEVPGMETTTEPSSLPQLITPNCQGRPARTRRFALRPNWDVMPHTPVITVCGSVRPYVRMPRTLLLALWLFTLAAPASSQTERKVTQLADGVYEIQHQDLQDGSASGNTTVIIGERQVFVVDSCFLPSAALEDIAQIRQWTDKPVSFLLNTHFHNDHNFGNRVYMDAFPALTIIAHAATKKEMDLFGPGSLGREEKGAAYLQQVLETGKTRTGRVLTAEEMNEVKNALSRRAVVMDELRKIRFQSATLTFEHDFTIDLGDREVQVKFLGRGNTPGDAVAYLPKEKIAIVGDLVVYPVPYIYDGYPSEWVETLQNLGQLDAGAIVPGHGPILRDKTYLYLLRDLLKSAVDQMNEKLRQTGPAMFQTLDDVKGGVDLTPFRQRFAGNDKDLRDAFDAMTGDLVKVVFEEASLR